MTPHDKNDRHGKAKQSEPPSETPADTARQGKSARGRAAPADAATDDQAAPAAALAGGDGLEARLQAATAERDQFLDHLQRLKAEFENYRKRVQRDNEALVLRAGEGVIESLLPVVDNMQRALEAAERHEEGHLTKGVELVAGQLRSVLESHGLDEVPAEPGVPFDPTVHEAVLTQEHDEYPEGVIVAVLERGFLLHGRLLRPARVIVSR
jgi:molecular chaperone GrpE